MTKRDIRKKLDALTKNNNKVIFTINKTHKIKVPINATNEEILELFKKSLGE